MKKYKKLLIIVFVLILFSLYLYIACFRHLAKSYVNGQNSSAKDLYKVLNSKSSLFEDYLEKYDVPKSGTVYLNGYITKYMNYYIDKNE